jgi:hypothetical protein
MKVHKIIFLHFSILICLAASNVYADRCTQLNNTITLVGLDHNNGRLFAGVSGHNNGCGCNNFRFYDTNTNVDRALSILLSAKMSGAKVRIGLLDRTDCNSAETVYLQ